METSEDRYFAAARPGMASVEPAAMPKKGGSGGGGGATRAPPPSRPVFKATAPRTHKMDLPSMTQVELQRAREECFAKAWAQHHARL